MRYRGLRTQERRAKIDVEGRVPVGGPQFVEWFPRVHRSHVDQDIEPAERVRCLRDRGTALVRRRKVGLDGDALAAKGADAVRALFGFVARARIGQRDVYAAPCELLGDKQADPPAAGDERRLATRIHFSWASA